jgi:hypothetical protein
MIIDDIRRGQLRCERNHALTLLHVLHHFLRSRPEAEAARSSLEQAVLTS